MKEKTKEEPDLGSIPVKGTSYWYIRSCMQTHQFRIFECKWRDGLSDLLRLAKGNVYLSLDEAESVASQLNTRLYQLKKVTIKSHPDLIS